MWFLTACLGLDTLPDRDKGGDDLDSVPLETGHPLDDTSTYNTGENRPPVADAGDDVDANVGVVVELDGSGSSDADGDAIAFAWELVSAPPDSSATLINSTRIDPSFVPDVEGRFVVELVVDDGMDASEVDEVEITAAIENGSPVANAGGDQVVAVGDTVTLDGSSSTDPDGDPLQFAWTLTSRPAGSSAALNSSSSATPRFTADAAGAYEVSLTVSDGTETSSADEMRVIAEVDGGTTGGTSTSCGCSTGGADVGVGILIALLGLRRRRG